LLFLGFYFLNLLLLLQFQFAGAAQSLGAGAILVNPWNITEVADSIRHALTMPSDEREKRHRHNYAHVTTHTAQDWAETFVCELNDTVAEAQLRTRQVPPGLPSQTAIQQYLRSKNRLLILVIPYFVFHTIIIDIVEKFFIMLTGRYNSEIAHLYPVASA
jgi:hypothetical protein